MKLLGELLAGVATVTVFAALIAPLLVDAFRFGW